MEIKCVGVTRCCRQKMLEKMYLHEDPFERIFLIYLRPAVYRGYRTMQLFVNQIDIGFIAQKDLPKIQNFNFQEVHCTMKENSRGYKNYNCYISGVIVE